MFFVPAKTHQVETTVKKSRFIATAFAVLDRQQAMQRIDRVRTQFPDAGHHCWAYLIGPPSSPVTAAMSDDGEPSGTAGKPILNVLQHKQVGNIMLIVSRYFGGIKLGAGGLVRAYSAAAQLAMESLPVIEHIITMQAEVTTGFAQEQDVRHWLSVHGGRVIDIVYAEQVQCVIEIPATNKPLLAAAGAERGWLLHLD